MNILFYTTFEVSPVKGGTERITHTVANGLQRLYAIKCYSIYWIPISSEFVRTKFEQSKQISPAAKFEKELYEFIKQYNIDILINQGGFSLAASMRRVLEKFKEKHLITVHHFSPGAEYNFFNLHSVINEIRSSNSLLKSGMKLAGYPILKCAYNLKIPRIYHSAYLNSDIVVLLSNKFVPEFKKYARIDNVDKFRYIPNALSFESFFNVSEYGKKKKEVLIVSRLDETFKRLSYALRIWEIVEQTDDLKEWKLTIVGHGVDENKYRKFVKNREMKRVSFEGVQNPERYYQRASIFMMTSASEGWGLTLTEAQQFGGVPLAFNSYSSLSEIIIDGENGFVIPDGDITLYANRLMYLMRNDHIRKSMALNAIESSKRFTSEKICNDWMSLFRELMLISRK